ncbi:uncharacterized protein LOC119390409 [Rhipicephalus sanguineus]|nr:uncharacterized protein LOC119390409 [Rhipicephalus sanguineus]
MNSDYDRSVLSESCAYSVSETGDARSQYAEDNDNYVTHYRSDGAGSTVSTASREGSVDRTEAVKRGGASPRDVGFRQRARPVVAGGVSSSTSMISVFWDIENCAVPNGVPAYEIVRKVRQRFYEGYREADFVVACDTARMSPAVIAELNEAQVTVIHVPGGQKNAADEKLRTVLRRFSDAHKLTRSRIVLISGDVDFVTEIHEMRYTDLIYVVLIHNEQAKRALRDAANESISYRAFLADLSNSKSSAPKVVRRLQFDTKNEGKDKGAKQDLKKSVPAVGDRVQETQTSDKLTNTEQKAAEQTVPPSYRTKVGLLVPREPMNAEFWRLYLSRLNIPQDFTLEVGRGGKDVVCLVYPSVSKARKAVEVLNDPPVDDADVPACLGIISKEVAEHVETATAEEPSRAAKVKSAVAAHKAKLEVVRKQMRCLDGDEKTVVMLKAAYEDQATIYEAQLTQFLKTISDLPQSPQKADNATTTEIARLKRASIVYGVKSRILEALSGRQVVFVTSSPGSRTALEVASYAQDLDLRVISVQSSDLAAEQCSKNAGSVSGLGPVQCWLNPKQPIISESRVVVTSVRHFFQEFMRHEIDLSGFKVVIVDELEEDSAYQRVVLAIIRKHFVSRIGVVLCGYESDACAQIQKAFSIKSQDVVRGALTFPVEVIKKEKPTNRVMACVSTALEFCQTAEESVGGDVLVFLPSLTDAFLADGLLRHKIREENIDVPITHDVLSTCVPSSPQKTESPRKGCWRVIFTVECPDAVVSTLRVRCVIDSGLTLRTIYQSGIFVMQLACVTKAEAEKRSTLAGIHESGTCYRLYDKPAQSYSLQADLNNSKYLEDIVLRLYTQQASSDTSLLDELLSKSLLEEVKIALQQIGALDSEGRTTDMGTKLCHTSLQPRVGMLVLRSMGKAPSLDTVLLSLLVLEDLLVAYRPLKQDGSQHDFPVSEEASVFSGVIQLYKHWLVVPKKMKSSWCDVNGINEAFMTYLHNAVRRVQQEFTEFKGRNLGADSAKEEQTATITLGELLAQSFPQGMLHACERGYKHPVLGDRLQVSPLSLFDTEVTKPQNVVCCLYAQVWGETNVKLLNFAALPDSFHKREADSQATLDDMTNQELVERFGPVGKLIWNHQFNSKRALQAVEEKLRARSDGARGYLELDAAGQCVVMRGHEKYCVEARECLRNIVKEQLTKLSRKDKEAFLTPRKSPYNDRPVLAVIGVGGHVNEVLSPAAFRTVVAYDITIPHANFRKRVNELGEIVQYWYLNQEASFEITYKTAQQANDAYRALSEQGGDLKVTVKGESLEYREEQRERRPAFHAQITLPRRLCTGTAFVQLPDKASFNRVAARLPLAVRLDNATVTIQRDKKVPYQLYITGLPSTASQSTLTGLIRASLSVDVKSVGLVREAAHKTTPEKLRALGDAVQKLFDEELGERCPKLVLNAPRLEDYVEKGWMSFEDPVVAQGTCALLKGSPVTVSQSGGDGGATLPMAVHILMEEKLYFPCSFFKAIQGRIEDEFRRQEGLRPEDNFKCDATPCGDVVRVKLKANNLNDFHRAVHLFNELLLGPDVPRVDGRVRPERITEVIRAASPGGGIFVYRKSGEARLVGEVQLVQAASEMLKRHTDAWEKRQKKKLPLVDAEFTLLRSYINTLGDDPWYLAKECKLDAATFDGQFQAIEVLGTEAAVREAEQLVNQLRKTRLDARSTADAGERCPICREPPSIAQNDGVSTLGHRLELCGHWYCGSCLLLALKRAPLPLTCFEKGCASPWAIADITHVAGNDQELLSDLARRSFEYSVAADSEGRWLPCPTPECHFALDSKGDAEVQGVHVMGDVHVCPGCTNAVCFQCRSLYHYGISCTTFQDSMTPNGANDKSWLSKDPGMRALCPSCKVRLERNANKKVGACWSCRRLFCWRCHRSFEDDAATARNHRKQYCQLALPLGSDTCCIM